MGAPDGVAEGRGRGLREGAGTGEDEGDGTGAGSIGRGEAVGSSLPGRRWFLSQSMSM